MQKYKVDWLSFTIDFRQNGDQRWFDEKIFKVLRFDLSEFEKITNGRFYYNTGITCHGFFNAYWNNPDKDMSPKTTRTMNIQLTGQGCTEVVERFNNDTIAVLKAIHEHDPSIKFTRIDIALDDNAETVSFEKIENKLRAGHYRSSKRTYNIVSQSNVNQEVKSKTVYLGSPRTKGTSVYLRIYDKLAQSLAKGVIPPEEFRESWQRYEIVYAKDYAQKVAEALMDGESVEKTFKQTLRTLLELLTPSETESNKARWKVVRYWDEFLQEKEKFDFSTPQREMNIAQSLEWLRKYVVPMIGLFEEMGKQNNFDFYEVLRYARKPDKLTKKQERMLMKSETIDAKTWEKYLKKFVGGYEIHE